MKRVREKVAVMTATTFVAAFLRCFIAAPVASATNIDTWHGFWQDCSDICLYYYQNLSYSGAHWLNSIHDGHGWLWGVNLGYPVLHDYKFDQCSFGDPGCLQYVDNHAASMGNGDYNCNVTTFYYRNYAGANNWLNGEWAGNLTPTLRNGEASATVDHCT